MTKKRVISKLLNLQSFIINNHDFSLILIKRDDYKKDYFKITTFTVIFLLWLILWILLDDYQYSLFNNDHNKGWRSKIMPRGLHWFIHSLHIWCVGTNLVLHCIGESSKGQKMVLVMWMMKVDLERLSLDVYREKMTFTFSPSD